MVIIVDSSTNQPIDALDSVEILQESGVQEELAMSGLEVTAITAQVSEPRPEGPVDGEQGGKDGETDSAPPTRVKTIACSMRAWDAQWIIVIRARNLKL